MSGHHKLDIHKDAKTDDLEVQFKKTKLVAHDTIHWILKLRTARGKVVGNAITEASERLGELDFLNPLEPEHPNLHWNAYVEATEAFLARDKITLELASKAFLEPLSPGDKQLAKFVRGLINCFEKPYLQAYSVECQ